jgi:hypothetical protein
MTSSRASQRHLAPFQRGRWRQVEQGGQRERVDGGAEHCRHAQQCLRGRAGPADPGLHGADQRLGQALIATGQRTQRLDDKERVAPVRRRMVSASPPWPAALASCRTASGPSGPTSTRRATGASAAPSSASFSARTVATVSSREPGTCRLR